MKKFSIEALARIIKAEPTNNAGVFTGVSIDSRTTKVGDCFFAITGDNFDGHNYVAEAFAKGAVCAVVSRLPSANRKSKILKVNDTIKALGSLAREYRRRMDFKVVAITGSVGKTTARQIAYHVLSQHYRVFQAPKNFNNNIGLPLTLLGADPNDQIVVAELGSNNLGEIAYLTRIALPDIAVITNVYPAHLAGFGNLQTIIKEKLSISEGLQEDGVLIINADFDRLVSTCQAKDTAFYTFGKSDGSNYQARNITHNGFGSQLTIDGTQVYLPLAGPGNVENALAAWAICNQFGLTVDDFTRAVKALPAVPMRAELLQIGTLTVLNDCYNANPASMKNALDILTALLRFKNSKFKIQNSKFSSAVPANLDLTQKRRRVFICGNMAELGQQSERLHAELGASIAQAGVQLLLAVGNSAKIAAQAAKRNAEHDLQIECFKDTVSACNVLKEFIKDSDIILVKGSRVARLEIAVEKLKKLFS